MVPHPILITNGCLMASLQRDALKECKKFMKERREDKKAFSKIDKHYFELILCAWSSNIFCGGRGVCVCDIII